MRLTFCHPWEVTLHSFPGKTKTPDISRRRGEDIETERRRQRERRHIYEKGEIHLLIKIKYTYNIIREVAYGIDAEAMFCNKQKEGDEKKKQERALRSF